MSETATKKRLTPTQERDAVLLAFYRYLQDQGSGDGAILATLADTLSQVPGFNPSPNESVWIDAMRSTLVAVLASRTEG